MGISERLRRRNSLRASITELNEKVDALARDVAVGGGAFHRQLQILRAIYDDEPGNRRRLWAMRDRADYGTPFTDPDPLVSIYVTTYSNADGLSKRCLPSLLAQTYENLEIIVVGDAASDEVAEVAMSTGDPRVRFENLTIRGPYPEDPVGLWLVAGTAPANEGLRLARGQWIGFNCDDDAFTPDHVEVLLGAARRQRLELVYGRIRRIDPNGDEHLIGQFPPTAPGEFGLQAAFFHRGLRQFPHELADALFGDPGDWAWIRRLVRAGVRIGMIDDIVVDYYPSQLWGTPARPPGLLGG